MAANFDFLIIRTSDNFRNSLVVSPDLENLGIAEGSSLLSCIVTELLFYFIFSAAIFTIADFRFHDFKVF